MASGYVTCSCRDCFETADIEVGSLCWECEEAGCECDGDSECSATGAYNGWEGDTEEAMLARTEAKGREVATLLKVSK